MGIVIHRNAGNLAGVILAIRMTGNAVRYRRILHGESIAHHKSGILQIRNQRVQSCADFRS